jgi:hypothetical protein
LWLQGRDRSNSLIGLQDKTEEVDFPRSNDQIPNNTMSRYHIHMVSESMRSGGHEEHATHSNGGPTSGDGRNLFCFLNPLIYHRTENIKTLRMVMC